MESGKEKNIFEIFEIAIILKGVGATLEVVLGVLLLFTNVVNNVVVALLQNELIEDPNDYLATHFSSYANMSHATQIYGGLYLLTHGLVKIVLVWGLLRNKLWAYPASIAVLSLFISYEVIKWFETRSVPLLLLTLFDVLVLWLVWHEYKRVREGRV